MQATQKHFDYRSNTTLCVIYFGGFCKCLWHHKLKILTIKHFDLLDWLLVGAVITNEHTIN